MEEEEVTLEDIKRLALDGGPLQMIGLMVADSPPLAQLALAAQAHQHGKELRRVAIALRLVATEQEHRELADAMRDAARAAQLAFDAAANAVWQLYWITQHCDCDECVQSRRRDKAEHN